MAGSRIVATGSYLPSKVVHIDDFKEDLSPYSNALQEYFNGVTERRHCEAHETGVMMGVEASKVALARANMDAKDIDLIISYSMFTDYVVPRDGNFMAGVLGAENATCWHLDTACSSFVSIMKVADAMLKNGNHRRALLILSTNWVGRGYDAARDHRCLGDGATAVVLEASTENHLIEASEITDSAHADNIHMVSPLVSKQQEYVIFKRVSEAKEYYKRGMTLVKELMAKTSLFPNDIDWFICHQPGTKMLDLYCSELEIDRSKNLNTVTTTGNLGATNLPFVLDHYVHNDPRIKRGDKILFYSPGGGIHYGAMIYQY